MFNLGYSVIDLSLNNGQGGIISTGNVLNSCDYFGGTAIAVGKLNFDNTHFLYHVGINGTNNLQVTRYTMDNSGTIANPVNLYIDNTHGLFTSVNELDLSFNDDKLVFATFNNLFILY